MRRGFVLAIVLALWVPSGAQAGSVSLSAVPQAFTPTAALFFTAAAGERNQIVVAREFTAHTNGAAS